MSLIDGISGAVGRLQASRPALPAALGTGQQPGGPSAGSSVTDRFGTVFKNNFDQGMGTVFASAANGEFDDAHLKLQEAALASRIAQQQSTMQQGRGQLDLGTGTPTPGATVPTTSGGVSGGGPAGAAAGPATTTSVLVDQGALLADQSSLYQLRARSAEVRLTNLSEVLHAKFPKGEQLISASSGTWDPATYVPKTKADAEAFAQRMTIDVSEAAARLDVLQSQVDVAKFEAQTTGGPAAQAKLAQLETLLARQQAWVTKLAGIVDKMSGGELTDAGEDAMGGQTARTSIDVPVDQIVAALRKAGTSEAEIKKVVGAGEVAVEEMPVDRVIDIMKRSGKSDAEIIAVVGRDALASAKQGPFTGSERLDRIEKRSQAFALDMWRHQRTVDEQRASDRREREERDFEEQRIIESAVERKYSERRQGEAIAVGKASERKSLAQAGSQQATSRRADTFQQFIAALDQRASETRNLRQAG